MTYPQFFLEKYILIVKSGHLSGMLPVACGTKQGR